MSDLVETSVISSGSISVSVAEPWVSEGIQRGSAAFQGDSVASRELQIGFRGTGPQLHIQHTSHRSIHVLA